MEDRHPISDVNRWAVSTFVRGVAESLPDRARVLDAGAGEGQYRRLFSRQRYLAIDLAVAELGWLPVWDFEETLSRTAKGYEQLVRASDAPAATEAVLSTIAEYCASAERRGAQWATEEEKRA